MYSGKESYLKELKEGLEERSKTKVEHAFSLIFEEYKNLLYSVAFGILHSKESAEDVVYESLEAFFNNIYNIDVKDEQGIKYYLVTTAKNRSIRLATSNKGVVAEYDDSIGGGGSEPTEVQSSESSLIEKVKDILSDEEYEIVYRHVIEDETFKEIAAEKSVSLFSISGKYNRAMQKVKEYCENEKI